MPEFKWIDRKALLLLHEESLMVFGGKRGLRDLGLFESALARPVNLALYDESADVAALTAAYGFGLAKNHPFVDGNKRSAFMAMGLFLGINGYRLTATPAEAIDTILALASGRLTETELANWLRQKTEAL